MHYPLSARRVFSIGLVLVAAGAWALGLGADPTPKPPPTAATFVVEETTIDAIHRAMAEGRLTAVGLVLKQAISPNRCRNPLTKPRHE